MKKKASTKPTKTGAKSKDGFERVETGKGKYHDFEENDTFIGVYSGDTLHDLGKYKSDVHVFHNKAGDKVLINGSASINEAIQKMGNGTYRFILKEIIRLKNAKGKESGKTFKVFDIGFHK